MDELTRVPERNDLIVLCQELNRLEAKYIIVGGLAMNALGLIRTTEDIDLLIEGSLENQAKVKQALTILPDRAIEELGEEDIREFIVVRINDEITIDLMAKVCGLDYHEAKTDIEPRLFNGVSIPFANRRLMIKTKQGRREKDEIDLRYLKTLEKEQGKNTPET
jgi:hypothetical protein